MTEIDEWRFDRRGNTTPRQFHYGSQPSWWSSKGEKMELLPHSDTFSRVLVIGSKDPKIARLIISKSADTWHVQWRLQHAGPHHYVQACVPMTWQELRQALVLNASTEEVQIDGLFVRRGAYVNFPEKRAELKWGSPIFSLHITDEISQAVLRITETEAAASQSI